MGLKPLKMEAEDKGPTAAEQAARDKKEEAEKAAQAAALAERVKQ